MYRQEIKEYRFYKSKIAIEHISCGIYDRQECDTDRKRDDMILYLIGDDSD